MEIEIRVAKSFPGLTVGVELRSSAPVTVLFGRSGCGKTSVLHMVAGVLRPDRGRIVLGGEVLFDSDARVNLRPAQRRCGCIFQDGRLFPHLSVRRNLLYGAGGDRRAPLSLDDTVDLLGIALLMERSPRTLSGGEVQRGTIGRVLLSGPRLLLMDEPLTYLDEARREGMFVLLARLRDEVAVPMLYVSHDRAEPARLGANVVSMEEPGGP